MSEKVYDVVAGAGYQGINAAAICENEVFGRGEKVGDSAEGEPETDEVTGASPGTAQACSDLGLNSLESNLERFGIKPPGVS